MSHTIQIMQMGAQIEQLENDKKELLGIIQDKDEAIAKLKEYDDELKDILKQVLRVTWGEGWNYSLDVKVKAEKFLKE